jgi:hypothetical protein
MPDQRPLTLVACAMADMFVTHIVATIRKNEITIGKRFIDYPPGACRALLLLPKNHPYQSNHFEKRDQCDNQYRE